MEDITKPYIFKYYIRALSEKPFSKTFIAKDEEEAVRQWHDWQEGVKFTIEETGNVEIVQPENEEL